MRPLSAALVLSTLLAAQAAAAPRFTLLFTGDNRGETDPCG